MNAANQRLQREIEERERAEARTERLNRVLRAIRDVNQLIAREEDREALLRRACDILTATRGYRSAWAALRGENGAAQMVAESGIGADFAPMREALQRGEWPHCCRQAQESSVGIATIHDTIRNCETCCLAHAYRDTAALAGVLRHGGRDYGALVVALPMGLANDPEEQSLFRELVGDVAYALRAIDLVQARVQSEGALRESERRLATLMANLPGMAYRCQNQPGWPMEFVSEGCLGLTGWPASALLENRPPYGKLIVEADRRWVWDTVQKALATKQPYELAYRIETAEGKVRWVWERGCGVFSPDGALICLEGFISDITKRHEAEVSQARLATAVEQAAEAIVITNPDGAIEYVNPAFEKISGYRREEVIGQNPRILKSGKQSAEFYQQMWERLIRGEVWVGHFINKRKDGTFYEEDASISPVIDAEGRIVNYVAVKHDVTEKKKLEAQFLRMQRLEGIGSLASGIAHDLNNILTPIVMAAPLLNAEESPETRRELVQTIESSAQRAVSIVKQLLGFARGREGQRAKLRVEHLVREIAKIAREVFPRGIQIEEDCASGLWSVLGDPTQLHQVLLNLCVNARDAMPSGGRLILRADNVTLDEHFVSMHQEASPGPFVRLQVTDTGTGIPENVQAHIFESFFTTKGEGLGSGLGLTTVRGIVREHNGFITFTTFPGKGTTFVVHLPAVLEPDALGETVQEGAAIPRGQGELVLVVDDEPAVCDTTRRTLERYGYAVLQANDGIEALAQFSAHRDEVRVVVTDYMMPLMDGVTLCRTLRVLNPQTPVIVSSGGLFGRSGGEARRTFEELGVRHILNKPHTAETLLRALGEVIHPGQT